MSRPMARGLYTMRLTPSRQQHSASAVSKVRHSRLRSKGIIIVITDSVADRPSQVKGMQGMGNTERHSKRSLVAEDAKVGSRMIFTCMSSVWTLAWAGRCAPLLQAPKAQRPICSLLFCTSGLMGNVTAECDAELPASGCLTGAGR